MGCAAKQPDFSYRPLVEWLTTADSKSVSGTDPAGEGSNPSGSAYIKFYIGKQSASYTYEKKES